MKIEQRIEKAEKNIKKYEDKISALKQKKKEEQQLLDQLIKDFLVEKTKGLSLEEIEQALDEAKERRITKNSEGAEELHEEEKEVSFDDNHNEAFMEMEE